MVAPAKPGQRQGVTIETVGERESGQRIDNYLLRCLKGVPKTHIYRLLRKGEVRVNGRRAKPETRLEAGDQVRIPPVQLSPASGPPVIPAAARERLEASVVFEDEYLLVIDKPAGLAVHGGSGLAYGVIEALRVIRPHTPFLELVHRLDRETSGCLLLAKNREVLGELHDLLREGRVEKHYLALLAGRWQGGARTVDESLARTARRGVERLVEVSEAGKEAVSRFSPVKRFAQATLMDVSIGTGRTHQIRVHAASLGHPVAGDAKYGDFAFNRDLKRLGLKRMFLHAARVSFRLPRSGRPYAFEAPLDPALEAVLKQLP